MPHDWYRSTEWSEAIEHEFRTRLKRTRDGYHRAQYLRIQGLELLETPFVRKGMELLREVIEKYPEEHSEHPGCWSGIASGFAKLNDAPASHAALRRAVEAEKVYPNMRTRSALELAYQLAMTGPPWNLEDLRTLLTHEGMSDGSLFPNERFRFELVRAVVAFAEGDRGRAAEHAQAAIVAAHRTHSGFEHHPKLGLVVDPPAAAIDTLVRIHKAGAAP